MLWVSNRLWCLWFKCHFLKIIRPFGAEIIFPTQLGPGFLLPGKNLWSLPVWNLSCAGEQNTKIKRCSTFQERWYHNFWRAPLNPRNGDFISRGIWIGTPKNEWGGLAFTSPVSQLPEVGFPNILAKSKENFRTQLVSWFLLLSWYKRWSGTDFKFWTSKSVGNVFFQGSSSYIMSPRAQIPSRIIFLYRVPKAAR